MDEQTENEIRAKIHELYLLQEDGNMEMKDFLETFGLHGNKYLIKCILEFGKNQEKLNIAYKALIKEFSIGLCKKCRDDMDTSEFSVKTASYCAGKEELFETVSSYCLDLCTKAKAEEEKMFTNQTDLLVELIKNAKTEQKTEQKKEGVKEGVKE